MFFIRKFNENSEKFQSTQTAILEEIDFVPFFAKIKV